MKSKIIDGRYLIECVCGSHDHILVFDIDKEFDPQCIGVYFTHDSNLRWYQKIIPALKYICGVSNYIGDSDIMITEQNIEELEEVVKVIKKFKQGK